MQKFIPKPFNTARLQQTEFFLEIVARRAGFLQRFLEIYANYAFVTERHSCKIYDVFSIFQNITVK